MTDDQRLEIERRFDGESEGREDLADDPEARLYLERLTLLRGLARRHDPASTVPRQSVTLPSRRPVRPVWWLALATSVAAILLLIFQPGFRAGDRPVVVLVKPAAKPSTRPSESASRAPLEVEFHVWANTPARGSQQAARLVLRPGSASKKRSPADEILALELANDRTQPRSGVQRFAVSQGSKPIPPSRPGPRAKTPSPDA